MGIKPLFKFIRIGCTISVWFWNRTANRETNRNHRNRTGTVHIHEPNRTGGKPNRLECEPQTRTGCKPVENRRHLPIFHSLFHKLLCLSSSGDVPCHICMRKNQFGCVWLRLAAEEKRLENGERRETGKSTGLDILGLGRLRLPNQGMELFPCPGLSILRFMCSLANCTPPENTVCFFHALKKANPSWKSKSAYLGSCFFRAVKKAKTSTGFSANAGGARCFRQHFRHCSYCSYKLSNLLSFQIVLNRKPSNI